MKWNLTVANTSLIAASFFFGLSFLFTNIYYWEIIDFLVYTKSDYSDFTYLLYEEFFSLVAKISEGHLFYILKYELLDLLISIFGHDLYHPIEVLFYFIALLSLFYLFYNRQSYAALIPTGIFASFLIMSFIFPSHVTKSQVDIEYEDYKYKDYTNLDYMQLLKDKQYSVLDKSLNNIEVKLKSGEISEQEYEFEYDKFRVKTLKDSDTIYFENWLDNTTHPQYALTAKGLFNETLAWAARGHRFAKDTSDEQFKEMQQYISKAIENYNDALNIDDKIFIIYSSLINISKSENSLNKIEIYEKAKSVYSSSYLLHIEYIRTLQLKWGGSYIQTRDFTLKQRVHGLNNPKLIALSGFEAVNRGYAHKSEGHYDKAILWYQRALLYGNRASIYNKLGRCYSKKKDYANGINILSEGINYHPDKAYLWLLRAEHYIKNKDFTNAEIDADTANNIPANTVWILNDLGWTYEKTKHHKKAAEAYIKTLKIDPDNIYAIKRLYQLSYIKKISYEAVLPYMKHRTTLQPENARAWVNYADTLGDIDAKKAIIPYENYLKFVDHDNKINHPSIKYVNKKLKKIRASN